MPEGRVQNLDNTGGVEGWFQSLPIITRYWFATALALTCGANFGLVAPMKLVFAWDQVKDSFEIWRFLTPFLYVGPFHFSTLIGLFMLLTFSKQYEGQGPYNTGGGGGTADYAFLLLFGVVVILCSYPLMLMAGLQIAPLFVRNLVFTVCYVWSKRNPTAPANIWGVPMKGAMLPFAYLALSVIMGNPYMDLIHGIVVGHIYYFLVDVVPLVYAKDILHTPQFLIDFFGVGEYTPAPVAPVNAPQNRGGFGGPGRVNAPRDPAADRQTARGHNWGGGGRALGSS